MFGRGRIKDGVRGTAKVISLGPTEKGVRQAEKRDAAGAAAALGFTLKDQ